MELFVHIAALIFGLASCAQKPVSGKRNFVTISEEQEIKTGQEADPQIRKQFGEYEDAGLQKFVNEIGQKLAKSAIARSRISLTVLDSVDISTFTLPGDYIYIYRGIATGVPNSIAS